MGSGDDAARGSRSFASWWVLLPLRWWVLSFGLELLLSVLLGRRRQCLCCGELRLAINGSVLSPFSFTVVGWSYPLPFSVAPVGLVKNEVLPHGQKFVGKNGIIRWLFYCRR